MKDWQLEEWELTAWSVPYGWGFSDSSLTNLSFRIETSNEWALDISFSKRSFLDSKIFLSACVCVWKKANVNYWFDAPFILSSIEAYSSLV
jgi:hypothetical protein